VRPAEAHPLIVTAPGEEGQVDYGEGPMVRHPETGKYRRTRLFVFTLGYSRKSVRLLTFTSSTRRWAELHEETFRRLGGAVQVVVLDNLREGVLTPDGPPSSPQRRGVHQTGSSPAEYRQAIDDFFSTMPMAEIARSLPVGKSGTTVPAIWVELGDNLDRWDSFRHVQGYAGSVPETERSGKHLVVKFRFACNTPLRDALHQLAFLSLSHSVWARAYYDGYRARNHTHHEALRALGAKTYGPRCLPRWGAALLYSGGRMDCSSLLNRELRRLLLRLDSSSR
jgi:Transposase IS116/IS110/IS902 family